MPIRNVLALCLVLTALPLCVRASGERIRLKTSDFDPLAVSRPAVVHDAVDYYILQFTGPVEEGWKTGAQALGIELLDYVPDFAFIVRAAPEAVKAARALSYVRWVGDYRPEYKISPRLKMAQGSVKVRALLFPDEPTAAVEAQIRGAGGEVRSVAGSQRWEHLAATLPAQAIPRLASLKEVAWVEPYVEPRLLNDVAGGLIGVPPVWIGVGLHGAGETVAIADTGLDTGSTTTISADFAGRIVSTYDLGRNKKWDDPNGHGTHVAGSVLGAGVLSGSNPATHSYAGSFAGVAPEASLVFQSILDNAGNLGGLPADLNQLFQPPYNDGARIHTNSWGAAVAGVYNTDSRNVDLFTWNHPDMTILFAAGNEGVDTDSNGVIDQDSIDSPGTAKNCITVGASESYRFTGAQGTYGGYWPSDFPANPIKNDLLSNNASGIVAFSSRGPTNDGRIKPDIVAPGTNIISCRSHLSGAGVLWGAYDSNYVYSGGTSMATPITAGAAALVREYYRVARGHTPTSALVKATLLNGATDLYPGQYGTGSFLEIPTARPNMVEGWGRVDLGYSLAPPPSRATEYVDNTTGLVTNGTAVYTYNVATDTSPVRVTLVWTDYPGSTIAAKALVNDLDLTVTLPNGSVRYGNNTVDRLNNVEGVDIASPPLGLYTVTVRGYNVPNGPQPFALVFSGNTGLPLPTASITAPTDGAILDGLVTITGTAAGAGFAQYSLDYGAGANPSAWTAIGSSSTTEVTNGTLGSWDTAPPPDGQYTIRLTVTGSSGSSEARVTVNLLRTRIADIKADADGTIITLTGKIVSADSTQLNGALYVQDVDRTSGIRVDLGTAQTTASVGSIVTVMGTLQTVSGERVITNPTVVVTGQ